METTQQWQVGGRLLGEGVYGCTFEPAPRCAGGNVFRTINGLPAVGKVTTEDITGELKIGRAIMGLPLAAQYFALPSVGCIVNREDVHQDPDASKCDILNKESRFVSKFPMLVMPAAGKTMDRWSSNMERAATYFERILKHLLEGMIIYQNAGYIHNDIHMGNILVDDISVARYIDFGLAFRLADIRTWADTGMGTRFKPKYVWKPPEVHAWAMMMNGVRLADGVRQLKGINPEYERLEMQFPSRKSALDSLTEFMERSSTVAKRDSGAFIQTYAKRFDSWRIGLCMWMIWDDLLRWPGFRATPLWNRRDLIRRVLGGLTDFFVPTRFTAEEALRILDPTNRLAASSLTTNSASSTT
jgi:hypothetical protein